MSAGESFPGSSLRRAHIRAKRGPQRRHARAIGALDRGVLEIGGKWGRVARNFTQPGCEHRLDPPGSCPDLWGGQLCGSGHHMPWAVPSEDLGQPVSQAHVVAVGPVVMSQYSRASDSTGSPGENSAASSAPRPRTPASISAHEW